MTHVWIRDEARHTERRVPLVPQDAAAYIASGGAVTVERSEKRIFPDEAFAQAGCTLVDSGSWVAAPPDSLVLGVKELPSTPANLSGSFAHFAHLFKDQRGWQDELARFKREKSSLYDLEYLTDESGRRVAAFGYWAGWIGAALGLWGWLAGEGRGPFCGVTAQDDQSGFLNPINSLLKENSKPTAIIIGALGRSGQGAADLLTACGIAPTRWDQAETANLDQRVLLGHDLLINCVLLRSPGLLLVNNEHLRHPETRLSMISDVACDPFSDFNPLPLYGEPTGWNTPFLSLQEGRPVYLTAIDNLPSLLPRESSEDFSSALLPVLKTYPDGVAWRHALRAMKEAVDRMT